MSYFDGHGFVLSSLVSGAQSQEISEGIMQIDLAEVHDKNSSDNLGKKLGFMVEFAKVIKKTGDDKEYQASIKPPHVNERDEQEPCERNCKRQARRPGVSVLHVSFFCWGDQPGQLWKRVFRGRAVEKPLSQKAAATLRQIYFHVTNQESQRPKNLRFAKSRTVMQLG